MSSAKDSSKKLKTDSGDNQSLDNMSHQDSSISALNDDCLGIIFSHLPIRERIKIQRVYKTWQKVSKSACRNIRGLAIGSELFGANYKGKSKKDKLSVLNRVFSLCGSDLKSVGFDSTSSSDLDYLKLIKQSCPNLTSIDLPDCNTVNLKFFIENFSQLSSISLQNCFQNCEKLLTEYFSKNKSLTSFSIEHNDHLTGSFLSSLSASVEDISIRLCKKISPENIGNALQKLTQLKELTLCGDLKFIEKINTILQLIPMNSTIETLDISFFYVRRTTKLMADALNVKSLTNLRELSLEGSILFYDETLPVIAEHCKKLEKVSLTDCEYITDWGLQPFIKSLNLKSLFISNSTINDVDYMASLKHITFHCCHSLEEYALGYLIKASKSLESLSVFLCEEISATYLIKAALKAHTRDEFLEVNWMDRYNVFEVKIAASRLHVIKDTSNRLKKEFNDKLISTV